jgi:hypothetical protein
MNDRKDSSSASSNEKRLRQRKEIRVNLSTCQQAVHRFTTVDHTVFDRLLFSVAHHGNGIRFNQTELAKEIGCTVRSVGRALRKILDAGFCYSKRGRPNTPSQFFLTDLLNNPRVRETLHTFYSVIPNFKINTRFKAIILSVKMLLSGYVSYVKEKEYPDPDPVRTGYLEPVLIYVPRTKAYKKRAKVVNQDTVRKVLDIERVLIGRGERLENMDSEKMAGFPEECLDASVLKMRTAKVKEPFRFFMHLCWKWCTENNREPNFAVSDHLREHDILAKYRALEKPGRAGVKKPGSNTKEFAHPSNFEAEKHKSTEQRINEQSKANLADYQARRPVVPPLDKKRFTKDHPLMAICIKVSLRMLSEMEDQWSPDALVIRKELDEWGVDYTQVLKEGAKW